MATFNKQGEEILDQTPVAIPVRLSRPATMAEQVRNLVRQQLSQYAADQGHETFEDADDFDVGDDYDPSSPYELEFDQEDAPLPSALPEEAPPPSPPPPEGVPSPEGVTK